MTPPACPKCDARMTLKTNRTTGAQFWGCTGYPRCKASKALTAEEQAAAPSPPPPPGPVRHWRKPGAFYKGEERAAQEIPIEAYERDPENQ